MSSHAASQDARSSQDAQRRKRKERSAKNRAPEPKDIVSGAGQPLDVSVRRELEEQLGHDFGQVRLHTDRDAGTLTAMLGADAVAVGQDIFFREGAYRPGTSDGQALLAHELLHTVQNPHGLGALRAGRDLGEVSLPQQAMEREAESAAQSAVSDAVLGAEREDDAAAEVEPGQATPGWLRYTTVDADRHRMEVLDPATLVDRLVGGVLRSLRGDPADHSGRVRMQLARMAPELQDSVLDRLEVRLRTPEYDHLVELVEDAESRPPKLGPALTPEPVPDPLDQLEDAWADQEKRQTREERSEKQRAEDAREEKEAAEAASDEPSRQEELSQESQDAAVEEKQAAERQEQQDERNRDRKEARKEEQQAEQQHAKERKEADLADRRKTEQRQSEAEEAKEERKAQRERERQNPGQEGDRGSGEREENAHKQADGSRPEDVGPKAKEQPGRARPEKVDERANERDSALSEHALHEKDEDEGEPREEEKPLGLEAAADEVIGGEVSEPAEGAAGVGGVELKPEDYLPETDLDLSSVPTAENPDAPMPTFPKPPPTKAEKVHEQRENDAEAEEDEDAPEAETKAPGAELGPVEGEAPQPEGGPASEAGDRTAKDLQTEKPVDQEVGRDPETVGEKDPEPEPEKADPEQEQEQQTTTGPGADEQRESDERDADGHIKPDAKDAEEQRQERKEQDERAEKQEAKGQPLGTAADKPATPAGSSGSGSVDASPGPPAGAHTEQTRTEDRHPSPAVRRVADSVKNDNEAADPQSSIPKQNGTGAAPSGTVGAAEPEGPSVAAGPGGAPPVAQAAVSPAGEQAPDPGRLGAQGSEGAKAKPEASLEKDGGGCAPPEPAPEKEEAKGGCAGGGGGQAKEEKKPEPPEVSGQDPKAALGTVSSLPPDQAQAALPGVDTAAAKKTRENRQKLAANPPTRERPSGAPQTRSAPPESAPPAAEVKGRLEKVEPKRTEKKQHAQGGEKAKGEMPTQHVPPPRIAPGKDGKVDAEDAGSIEAAADAIPTTDPALRNKTVGPAPKIKLEGKSDPARTDRQKEQLGEKQGKIQQTGREDAAKPLGEGQVYPDVPPEQLRGEARGGGGRRQAPGQQAGAPADMGTGKVAKQERGREIRGAAGQARGQMVSKEKEHRQGEQQAKRQNQAEIDAEVARNADKQAAERGRAAEQADGERRKWRDEQDKKTEEADKKSEKEHGEQNKKIVKGRDEKEKEIKGRQKADNKEIDKTATKAEKDAEKKKEEKKEESDSLFGKIVDAIGDFFSALLDAVTAIFDAARKAINGLIDKFKEFANKAIDFVRDLAIKAINAVADALIAICDVLLAAFPALRDKFRRAIESMRDAAINAVNELADGLKKAVNALLDALAAGLNALLDVLEAGLKFAIKLYRDVLIGALKFAKAAIEALGKFAELVADIAPDPGGWLSRLGSSAKSGITDHLWGAIKTGVKRWFDNKVEGILGLGKAVINVLVKGCVSIKQIGKMAWDAIIASLPMMIASIVIEKVISMLVPAAGAILTICQGLMAAWQSLSSILTAFSKFWDYLKAVKAGPAACLFAEAVAAGIVALLEFISNFLLIRLEMATKGVCKRLKSMAQKIMKGLKKTGKGAKKAAGGAVNRARGAARAAKEALSKPARAPRPSGPRVPKNRADSTDRSPTAKPENRPPKDATYDRPTSKTPKQDKGDTAASETTGPKDRTPEQKPDSKPDKSPDPKPDTKKDKAPETPKKKKETEAPKRTKPRKPTSPLGKVLKKVKGKVKSALKKVRNAGKTLGKKLRKSRLGKALKKTGSRLRNFFKKMRDRLRNRKHNRPDRTRKNNRDKEKDKRSKQKRLRRAVSRIHRILKRRLKPGIPTRAHNRTLDALRHHYRLSSLTRKGYPDFTVWATLNPPARTIEGVVDPYERADFLDAHGLPDPIIPRRRDDSTGGSYGKIAKSGYQIPPKNVLGEYLSKVVKQDGEEANLANENQPLGWEYVTSKGLSNKTAWVRMHLMPGAGKIGIGGLVGGNNLVPARKGLNDEFFREIESHAFAAVPDPHRMIWYKATAEFGHSGFPGFPKKIEASYGTYDKVSPGRTGRKRGDWKMNTTPKETHSASGISEPDTTNPLQINTAGAKTLHDRLGLTYPQGRLVAGTFEKNESRFPKPVYTGPDSVEKYLKERAAKNGGSPTPDTIHEIMEKIRNYDGKIDWSPR